MRRCVIVGGAAIHDYERVQRRLREDDYIICCDSGLRHCRDLGIRPDLIVGDFDSHENPHADIETIVLPCEKDDTDTSFAAKEALRRGFTDFLLLGVVGGRLDHTLGNLSVLLMIDAAGAKAEAMDDYADIEIVSKGQAEIPDTYAYFSVISMCGSAHGVTIEHAKYPLRDAEISCEYQYGISNEVLPGEKARVSVDDGRLLLIKVADEHA